VLFGLIMQNVLLGVLLAVIVSIGWLIAYESWRGRTPSSTTPGTTAHSCKRSP
jgi:hypothetical protein